MRGLKHGLNISDSLALLSHPTWVRGLKLYNSLLLVPAVFVAPYVGAWIETNFIIVLRYMTKVAPYVGAWIETYSARIRMLPYHLSRTLRGCVD